MSLAHAAPFRALVASILLLAVAVVSGCATSGPQSNNDAERKARAHYSMAMGYLREGKVALAIRELQGAEELTPRDPWVHLALGEAYRLRGKESEAEKHLKRAIGLRPGFQPALLNLSALYIQVERYDEAIAISDQLLDDATFPVPWKALTNKGYALSRLGRSAEARDVLDAALEYHPDFWPAVLDVAILDAEQGRHVEALEGFEHVLELTDSPLVAAEAHYRIGLVYVSLGNREQAMHHLTVATQAKPSGQWGKRSEDYLKRLR
jgi:Tfp pilus assembly protein PilF